MSEHKLRSGIAGLGLIVPHFLHYEEVRAAIAGYALANDVSEREFQSERGGQWVKGKSAETFNPAGPWLATPDEIANVKDLSMWLDVNGVQDLGTQRQRVVGPR